MFNILQQKWYFLLNVVKKIYPVKEIINRLKEEWFLSLEIREFKRSILANRIEKSFSGRGAALNMHARTSLTRPWCWSFDISALKFSLTRADQQVQFKRAVFPHKSVKTRPIFDLVPPSIDHPLQSSFFPWKRDPFFSFSMSHTSVKKLRQISRSFSRFHVNQHKLIGCPVDTTGETNRIVAHVIHAIANYFYQLIIVVRNILYFDVIRTHVDSIEWILIEIRSFFLFVLILATWFFKLFDEEKNWNKEWFDSNNNRNVDVIVIVTRERYFNCKKKKRSICREDKKFKRDKL